MPKIDEYIALIADTAGPLGLAVRRLPEPDRMALKTDVEDAIGRFATGDGYALPGVALCAVAR